MWMEKHMLSAPTDMAGRSSSAINETPQNPTPNSLIHQCYSMLSGVHGEALSCDDVQLINPGIVAESNFLVASHGKDIFGTSSPINNSEFQEHTPTSLAARIGLEEKSSALSPSVSSLEALGVPCILETWPYTPNHFHGNGSAFQIGNLDSNVANLTDHAYTTSSNFSNELVLSLATSSASSRELPMSLNSSQAMLGSRFLIGIQDILAQLARFSLENLQQISFSAEAHQNANSMSCEAHVETPLPAGSMKSQLLTLLELVDNRYSQCLDEVHLVVSAFHAATELDPHLHAHFSLQTISLLYKGLRERISNYILAMGADLSTQEKQTSTETSLFENQWALQQLKRKEHQSWRPQRGLPENSVSVLRAWMFQNFLHPYPKDAEKHLLAVKSGLTRSQVSNWFINARVRLWKPMIEEMYAEMNKRKACRNEEGTQSSPSSRISLSNHKFNMR